MELRELIAAETERIDRVMRADLDRHGSGLDPLLSEILEYGLFSGGKRVRPLLAVLGARLCGRDDESLYELAIAFEYLHVATLFHDDVIDRADTRRGRPSVNRKYGAVAAILAGDFLHAHSMALIGHRAGGEALATFSAATRGMVDGEFVQLRNARNFSQSEDDYFAVVMGKTALLIGAACEIGAMYGGADTGQQEALRSYGTGLGCAFQIIDDLLDYLGDQAKTGKAVGNDLVEGKMTLPLILALRNADPADRTRLIALLGDAAGRAVGIAEVTALIEKYRGFVDARTRAESIIGRAVDALDRFEHGGDRQSLAILRALARHVLSREN